MLNGEAKKFGMDPSWIDTLAEVLYSSRPWHRALQEEFEIHSAVRAAFSQATCCDWHRLVLEWPHVSKTDSKMLAYVRSEDKAEADKNTKTTIGKYLKRHFPGMKDDVIRDLAYRHSQANCKFVTTTKEMVNAVQNGPSSCMQFDSSDLRDLGGHHPYEVYDPQFGWKMAIRLDNEGNIVGRALVHCDTYVRSYSSGGNDDELEGWLEGQGVERQCGWDTGTKLRCIRLRGEQYLAPYVDGSVNDANINHSGSDPYFVLRNAGDFEFRSTSGSVGLCGEPCPDCGQDTEEDEQCPIGRHEGGWVCSSCLENYYCYVEGYRGSYYVHQDDAVNVDDEWYDENNLPDSIIELVNGDLCHRDNAVQCSESDNWYRDSDDDIVTLENGEPCHKDYAWQCEESGEWYGESEDYVLINGCKYHPDNAPEEDEDEDEDDEAIKAPLGGYDKPEGSISNEALAILELAVPHKWQHIIDAHARGEVIEARWTDFNDTWDVMDGLGLMKDHPALEWRIKPVETELQGETA